MTVACSALITHSSKASPGPGNIKKERQKTCRKQTAEQNAIRHSFKGVTTKVLKLLTAGAACERLHKTESGKNVSHRWEKGTWVPTLSRKLKAIKGCWMLGNHCLQ